MLTNKIHITFHNDDIC